MERSSLFALQSMGSRIQSSHGLAARRSSLRLGRAPACHALVRVPPVGRPHLVPLADRHPVLAGAAAGLEHIRRAAPAQRARRVERPAGAAGDAMRVVEVVPGPGQLRARDRDATAVRGRVRRGRRGLPVRRVLELEPGGAKAAPARSRDTLPAHPEGSIDVVLEPWALLLQRLAVIVVQRWGISAGKARAREERLQELRCYSQLIVRRVTRVGALIVGGDARAV